MAPIHARIERQTDGGFIIRRMGLNPISLRGEPLLQTASLKPGDSFRLSTDIEFQFLAKPPASQIKADKPSEGTAGKPGKPLLKRPEFLAAIAIVYLGAMTAVAFTLFSDDGTTGGSSSERVNTEAAGILQCIKSARRMHTISAASFDGAVSGRSTGETVSYASLAASADPSDDDSLGKAVAPIADTYRRLALAAVASEIRGNLPMAHSLYQQAFDAVPDINCSAARFVMDRRAATAPDSKS
ncbi:hypothetical protein GGD46_004356 [Rhizobium lusitanum]|uniref:FHA domain-containing protein n=1 Tax=Rhizobium lusitanum TaxID=293958 RepID=A0A7X0ME28_9HYPH|nr:hypothetical protein [Rhizobium lusitanum]